MDYAIRLEQRDSQPLAVVRRTCGLNELSRIIPEACGIVWKAVRAQNIAGADRLVAVYLDDQISLEIGAEVPTAFPDHGEVVASATPAGLVATTTHYGPYAGLGEAHAAIGRWCKSNGHKLAGTRWEVYGHWKDEWNTDPSKIRTDVFYLIDG